MPIPTSIEQFLKSRGVAYTALQHPLAYTAQEEAAVSHVKGREWAKTVVCLAEGEPIMAVLPAHYSVDVDRLGQLAGKPVRLAREDEMAPLYPDCDPGAMPPLGPLYGQRVFVETALTRDPEIVFNGGTHSDAIRIGYDAFAALVRPIVGEFGRPPGRQAVA